MTFDFLKHRFGGKKNALRWVQDCIAWKTGAYHKASAVRWGEVQRLIFVCKGNICRSAYADWYLRKHFPQLPVTSCGVATTSGGPADGVAKRVAEHRGVSLEAHVTQRPEDLNVVEGDLFLYLEPAHFPLMPSAIASHAGVQHTFVGLWANRPPYIPDPYGMPETYFHHCFTTIERALASLTKHLEHKL